MKFQPQALPDDDLLQERRFQRDAERLHRLGPRVIYEILAEIGRARMCRTYVEDIVARYARLDLSAVHALDGDRFPAPPIHEVA